MSDGGMSDKGMSDKGMSDGGMSDGGMSDGALEDAESTVGRAKHTQHVSCNDHQALLPCKLPSSRVAPHIAQVQEAGAIYTPSSKVFQNQLPGTASCQPARLPSTLTHLESLTCELSTLFLSFPPVLSLPPLLMTGLGSQACP